MSEMVEDGTKTRSQDGRYVLGFGALSVTHAVMAAILIADRRLPGLAMLLGAASGTMLGSGILSAIDYAKVD